MSAYLEVSGPDEDKSIARSALFCTSALGRTSISCSGTTWECTEKCIRIVTAAAALSPFWNAQTGKLMKDVTILVRVHGITCAASLENAVESKYLGEQSRALLNARTAGSAGCKFGWSLAPGQCCPADISRIAIITCDAKAAAKLSSQLRSSGCPYKLPVQASPLAMVGDPIMAIGSPFGVSAPELFSDMVISGIVSRLSMRDTRTHSAAHSSGLLLADLAVLPGMEGCPVISTSGLLGMLTFPASVADHSVAVIIPVGLLSKAMATCSAAPDTESKSSGTVGSALCQTLHAPLSDATRYIRVSGTSSDVSQRLCKPGIEWPRHPGRHPGHQSAILQQVLAQIVGIVLPDGHWASGVLISKSGVFATNAHLFDHLSPAEVARVLPNVLHHGCRPRWHSARILHIFTGALDLAILQMLEPPHDLQPLELNTSALHVGQSCYVAGHALFRPSCTATPMLTAGNVSKVLSIPDAGGQSRAAMLLTTAAVHIGSSGGAIVSDNGTLLGIVTSNTKHASGVTLSKLNYSIASEWLLSLWAHIQLNEVDTLQLHLYDERRPQLLKLWCLQPGLDEVVPHSKL